MKIRAVVGTALAVTAIITLVDVFVGPTLSTDERYWLNGGIRTGVLLAVTIASLAAASRFGFWREHVGRAWTLFSIMYGSLTISEVLRRTAPDFPAPAEAAVVIANLVGIGAYWLMSRSLKEAGLDYYGPRSRKSIVITLAAVLAIALCHEAILSSVSEMSPEGIGSLVSAVADMIMFLLVAPLVLTTMQLRGGSLSWVYGLLAAGTVGWMLNQGAKVIVMALGGGGEPIRNLRLFGFVIACALITSSAIVQRMAAARSDR